jgi:hypothetical protein
MRASVGWLPGRCGLLPYLAHGAGLGRWPPQQMQWAFFGSPSCIRLWQMWRSLTSVRERCRATSVIPPLRRRNKARQGTHVRCGPVAGRTAFVFWGDSFRHEFARIGADKPVCNSRLRRLLIRDRFSRAFHRKRSLSTTSAQPFAQLSPTYAAVFLLACVRC